MRACGNLYHDTFYRYLISVEWTIQLVRRNGQDLGDRQPQEHLFDLVKVVRDAIQTDMDAVRDTWKQTPILAARRRAGRQRKRKRRERVSALFSFSGRVGRSSYWMVTGAGVILYLVFVGWMASLDPWQMPRTYTNYYNGESGIYWGPTSTRVIFFLFAAAWLTYLIAGLSVNVRRWHDHDKSGWWVFIGLVPIVGGIYTFAMQGCRVGDPDSNQYGPPPGPSFVGTWFQRIAHPRDQMQAVPVATILSLIGTALTVAVLSGFITPYVEFYTYRYESEFRFGHFLLVCIAVCAALAVSSYYGGDLVARWGFRRVSIIADVTCVIGVLFAGIWFSSFVMVVVFTFVGIALRLAAFTAYRSLTPSLATRFGIPVQRMETLFDTFPYCALLVVPLLVYPFRRMLWELTGYSTHFEWLYVLFFAFSAVLVTVAIPANAVRPTGVAPEPSSETSEPIEEAASWS